VVEREAIPSKEGLVQTVFMEILGLMIMVMIKSMGGLEQTKFGVKVAMIPLTVVQEQIAFMEGMAMTLSMVVLVRTIFVEILEQTPFMAVTG